MASLVDAEIRLKMEMQAGDLRRKPAEARRDRVELDLFDPGLGFLVHWVNMYHVVRSKQPQAEVLCISFLGDSYMHFPEIRNKRVYV